MWLSHSLNLSFFRCFRGVVCIIALGLAPVLSAQEPAEAAMPAAATKALDAQNWEQVITALAQPGPWSNDPDALFWLGTAYYNTGKYKQGLGALRKSWKMKPGNRNVALMLVRCAAEISDSAWAGVMARAFPSDGEIHHFAGMAHLNAFFTRQAFPGKSDIEFRRNMAGRAHNHFLEAARLGYDEARNHRALAFTYNRRGRGDSSQHKEAIKHARRAIALAPVGAEVHMLLASSLIQEKRFSEALRAYKEANRLAPTKKVYFEFERGKALYEAGFFNQAADAFLVALAADKYHNSVRYWTGKSAYAAGNYRLAIWAFGESAKLDDNISAYYMLGRCAYDLENDVLAEHYFRQVLAKGKAFYNKKTNKPQAHWSHYLGRALWGQGKKEEALQHLNDAFTSDTDNMLYARWLFLCHLENDDPISALKICRTLGMKGEPDVALKGIETVMKKWPFPRPQDRAAGKPPHFAVAAMFMAEISYKYRRYHRALSYYEKLRQSSGKYAKTQAAWCMVQTGKFAAAEQCFRDYIAHQPEKNHNYGDYGLGCVFAHQGKVDEAKAQAEKITHSGRFAAKDSLLLWCAQQKKDADATSQLTDPYTALGIYSSRTRSAGLRIMILLPGSPLTKTQPRIVHGDIIRQVGDFLLGSKEQMKALRASPMPKAPVTVRVWRGEAAFEVSVDLNTPSKP